MNGKIVGNLNEQTWISLGIRFWCNEKKLLLLTILVLLLQNLQ